MNFKYFKNLFKKNVFQKFQIRPPNLQIKHLMWLFQLIYKLNSPKKMERGFLHFQTNVSLRQTLDIFVLIFHKSFRNSWCYLQFWRIKLEFSSFSFGDASELISSSLQILSCCSCLLRRDKLKPISSLQFWVFCKLFKEISMHVRVKNGSSKCDDWINFWFWWIFVWFGCVLFFSSLLCCFKFALSWHFVNLNPPHNHQMVMN